MVFFTKNKRKVLTWACIVVVALCCVLLILGYIEQASELGIVSGILGLIANDRIKQEESQERIAKEAERQKAELEAREEERIKQVIAKKIEKTKERYQKESVDNIKKDILKGLSDD